MQAMGRLYSDGLGVEVDLVESYAWHQLAASRFKPQEVRDLQLSQEQAARVAAQLSAEQLEQAAQRLMQLEILTRPPEPEKPLGPGETRT